MKHVNILQALLSMPELCSHKYSNPDEEILYQHCNVSKVKINTDCTTYEKGREFAKNQDDLQCCIVESQAIAHIMRGKPLNLTNDEQIKFDKYLI